MATATILASWFVVTSAMELSQPRIEDWRQTVARLNNDPLTAAELPGAFTIDHSFADPSITPQVAEVLGHEGTFIYAGTTDLAGGGYLRSRISFVVYRDLADARAAIEELFRAGQGPGSHVVPYRMAQMEAWDLSDRAVCWHFHPSVECYALVGSVVVSGETLPPMRARLGPDWFSSPNATDARLLLESGLRHLFTIERYPVP